MKPYFAKYLPVEGEIKEGDIIISPTGEIAPAKTPAHYNNPHVPYWDGFKKVKLFLCSRDIKFGDTIRGDADESVFTPRTALKAHENFFEAKEKGDTLPCFSVIGEILTPGIQEGQEFTEKEVDFLI